MYVCVCVDEDKPTSRSETLAGTKRRSHDGGATRSSALASSARERSSSPGQPATKAPRLSSQEAPAAGKPVTLRRSQDSRNRAQERQRDTGRERKGDQPQKVSLGRGFVRP